MRDYRTRGLRAAPALWILMLLLIPAIVSAQADSMTKIKKKHPETHYGHQLRFGFDIGRPVINLAQSTRTSYEGEIDYYLKNEVYVVAEGGAGSAVYDYTDLSYRSANSFFRAGVDKTLITRLNGRDWDAAFFGARYGIGFINRQEATYTIVDSLWGATSGIIPAKTFTAHWAEITGGVRVELLKGFFAGWNVRGKFLLNGSSFGALSPVFIAGYGKGDKSTVFDFNFYICYALRRGGQDDVKEKAARRGGF